MSPHPGSLHPVSLPLTSGPSQGLLTRVSSPGLLAPRSRPLSEVSSPSPAPHPHLPQILKLHALNSIRVSRSPITPHLDSHHTARIPHICTPGVVPDSRGPPPRALLTHSIPMLFTPPHTHTHTHTHTPQRISDPSTPLILSHFSLQQGSQIPLKLFLLGKTLRPQTRSQALAILMPLNSSVPRTYIPYAFTP